MTRRRRAPIFTPEQAEGSGWQQLAGLDKIEEGGLGAAFFVAYTDQGPLTDKWYAQAFETVVEKIDAIRHAIDPGPPDVRDGI